GPPPRGGARPRRAWGGQALRRPAAQRGDPAVPVDQARGQAESPKPRQRRLVSNERGCGRDVRLGAVGGGDADRAPPRARRRSGGGGDDVVHAEPAVAPAPPGCARGGQAIGADRDRLSRGGGVAAVVIGHAYAPALARGNAGG